MARKALRMSKREYLQRKAAEYMRIHNVTVFDPEAVAQWMVESGDYQDHRSSLVSRAKNELTKALREQRMDDPQGRDVRAMIGARYKGQQGELFSKWAPLFQAPPDHVRLALQQWRRGIRGEVLLQDRTLKSYNDNNVHGAQLPLFDYDFNKDRAESEMPPEYPDEDPNQLSDE